MLDAIRSNAQSLGVKIIFAVIIIVFVFWGVGSFMSSPSSDIITVNGEPISAQEILRSASHLTRQIQQSRPGMTEEDLKPFKIRYRAAQQLIMRKLLSQEAKRLGIAVTPVELRKAIESLPYFRNQDGVFDPEVYKRVLATGQETPGTFEEGLRQDLLIEKLSRIVTAGATVAEEEVRSLFDFQTERRALEYVLFPASDYAAGDTPKEEDVRAWYEAHQDAFKVPASADVDYLLIGAESLAASSMPDDAAVAAFYEKNKDRFAIPEQVHARHILIKVPAEDAEAGKAALARLQELRGSLLKKKASFAEAAKKSSDDKISAENGGDLGWFTRGQMVPEFEESAFALKEGEFSEPVKTAYGYHLILVEGRRPAGTRPLNEVKETIRRQIGTEQAAGRLQDVLDQILLAVMGGKSLEAAGEPFKLTPANTGSMKASELAAALDIKPEEAAALLKTKPGAVNETPFVTKKGYVLARVKESTPERVKPFEEVKAEISKGLAAETRAKRALDAATAARSEIKDGALPSRLAGKAKKSDPIDRSGSLAGLGANAELGRAAFSTAPGEWLPAAYPVEKGAVIARVLKSVPAEDGAWDKVREMMMSRAQESRRAYLFEAFCESLRAKAKVLLQNQKFLED
ncbi:MAG: SurA N-terminal domain-containing protein [Desulfovibrionaceae bacterium]|nr:SurA N-terminal domain-containing protein [Desulfovibrionaceae bacterium]